VSSFRLINEEHFVPTEVELPLPIIVVVNLVIVVTLKYCHQFQISSCVGFKHMIETLYSAVEEPVSWKLVQYDVWRLVKTDLCDIFRFPENYDLFSAGYGVGIASVWTVAISLILASMDLLSM